VYFGGLLPEGYQAREAIGRRFGLNPNSTFELIGVLGPDCAGAVSVRNIDDSDAEEIEQIDYTTVSDKELAQLIRDLPRKPLFIDPEGQVRISLAGIQDKAAVCVIQGRVALAVRSAPSTHILKGPIRDLPGSIENEYLCLRLGRALGLTIPEVELRVAEDVRYLLIKRFDREILGTNRVRRIHQEDFCQALGVRSSMKYQRDGGPGFADCFRLLDEAKTPATDRNNFARAMLFNYFIGNMDAHAKNFSVIHFDTGFSLAPSYDLLNTLIYEDVSTKMAMKIDHHYEWNEVFPRHWERLARSVGFSYPALRKLVAVFGTSIVKAAEKECETLSSSGIDSSIIEKWLGHIRRSSEMMLSRFARSA
jgi:serine/threonine-protein kinase HipA